MTDCTFLCSQLVCICLLGVCSEDAGRCFSRLLELDPDSGLGHLGLGIRALEEGKCDDSIKYLAQGEQFGDSGLLLVCGVLHHLTVCCALRTEANALQLGGLVQPCSGPAENAPIFRLRNILLPRYI